MPGSGSGKLDWVGTKTIFSDAIGLSRDALHLLAGVAVQFAFVLVLRRWFGALLPWLLTLAAAVGNEWLDLTFEVWTGPERKLQWHDSIKDVILTILLPTFILLLCRYLPARLRPPGRGDTSE